MAEESQESQIEKFIELTNSNEDRARFYLESSGWNITVAVSTFLETTDDEPFDSPQEDVPIPQQSRVVLDDEMGEVSVSDTDEEFVPDASAAKQKKNKKSYNMRSAGGARIATLRKPDSSDEDEKGQAFFVGGGERSGQQILGPSKKDKKKAEEVIEDLFKSAKEHGAEVVDPTSSKREKTSYFKGTGYKLGQDSGDAEVVAGAPPQAKPKEVTLKLWKNGFSVDNGPLRMYEDPKNRLFLMAVKQGQIPLELVREARGGSVHLDMEDHRDSDFEASRSMFSAFAGAGHMLGSPTPAMSGPGCSSGASAVSDASLRSDSKELEKTATESVNLDVTQPLTNIQIRFNDGSRLVAKFNHGHSIQDIRRYIGIARPAVSMTPFVLIGGVPAKELTDESSSLKDLGLIGSSLMVRNK